MTHRTTIEHMSAL